MKYINYPSIPSLTTTSGETAWAISDIFKILDYCKENTYIVLGGDILNENLDYTYDNWYYDTNANIDLKDNSNKSILKANEYISNYIKKNGVNYYVVIVAK